MGGSKSGQVRCAQMPEKSGIDVTLCLTLLSGPAAGAITCAHAGIAPAAANAINARKFRCAFMPTLRFMIRRTPSLGQSYLQSGPTRDFSYNLGRDHPAGKHLGD